MGIRFEVARHSANAVVRADASSIKGDEDLLLRSWGQRDAWGQHETCNTIGELLQSSFPLHEDLASVTPCTNGFVQTAVVAYGNHHHLVIRSVNKF